MHNAYMRAHHMGMYLVCVIVSICCAAGINWAVENANDNNVKGVISMSLGGGKNTCAHTCPARILPHMFKWNSWPPWNISRACPDKKPHAHTLNSGRNVVYCIHITK